ncbi:MAG: translation initiation factor IF-2 subunit beta [Nanoarchaeota archaeon]|nr:translation initiation factor IF-2 subunit beta [Nanoarchaeota archaeon]
MEDYKKLLKKALSELPESTHSGERFEIPKVKGHVEGNKTIITNFNQICSTLRRESTQLIKYLQRELATPAIMEGTRLVLGRKVSSELINSKIERYVQDFVLCQECKKPDTILKKQDKILIMECAACGARHTVKAKI